MLMITRTESLIEIGRGEGRAVALDVSGLLAVSLATERMACGRIRRVLAVEFGDGRPVLRIDGSPVELAALHDTVTEMMLVWPRREIVH
jgi:hypothetical protein